MRREMSYEEKYKMMIETPVNKLIPRLAVPTIISMLITSIYNMADTFFVSQLSTAASGAVGVNFSLICPVCWERKSRKEHREHAPRRYIRRLPADFCWRYSGL